LDIAACDNGVILIYFSSVPIFNLSNLNL
jgi:hypothetical protein